VFKIFQLYTSIQILLYSCQQNIYFILSSFNNYYVLIKFIFLLFLGTLTSLTPCFLSFIPVVFSYFNSINASFLDKIMMILGLFSSLIILICSIYLFNSQAISLLVSVPILSYLILMIIALNLLQILDFSSLFFFLNTSSLDTINYNSTYLKSYTIGFFIGLGSLPCNIGIILTTISWLYNSINLIQSIIFLFIYLIGCILPFFIVFFLLYLKFERNWFINFWNTLVPFSGASILSFALFLLLEKLFI